MKYNYYERVAEDVKDYILNDMYIKQLASFGDFGELAEYLSDELWTEDTVTGNGSGSYTLSAWQAEEYIAHNWGLINEAVEEFEGSFPRSAEEADVLVRCYVLPQAIEVALEDEKVIAHYREAREKAAIELLKEDGWEGADVSLEESLLEHGLAVKMEGKTVETLYYVGEEDGVRQYYSCELTRNQYAEDFGILVADDDTAADVAYKIEKAQEDHRRIDIREVLSGFADSWVHYISLADYAL